MNKSPVVLIVIVNYNHARDLENLVKSVLATEYAAFRVILVDNASTDKSRSVMNAFNDTRLTKVFLNENIGLCKARNLGTSLQEADYFAFLDPDVIVGPAWLQNLVVFMERDNAVGIAESNILSEIPWASSSSEHVKLYALGAAFIVRERVWNQLGGFDEDFFVGYDDQDLGWRTWLLGYQVAGVSDSIVYHFPGSLRKGELNRFFRYHDFKNRLTSLLKNLEFLTILYQTPRIVSLLAGFFHEDFRRKQTDGIHVVYWMARNMGKLLQKRSLIQQTRMIKDRDFDLLWNPSVRGSLRRRGFSLW